MSLDLNLIKNSLVNLSYSTEKSTQTQTCSNIFETEENISNENDSLSNESSIDIIEFSAVIPGISGIIGGIVDAIDGDTKDGTIDDTEQRMTGDCWLLSAVNSLSYTDEGKEFIKNALDYQDGYTIVHLAAGNYIVTDDEVTQTKGSLQYSSGDDDMVIFELAIEKVRDDIAEENLMFSSEAPITVQNAGILKTTTIFNSSINAGSETEAWYYITGKTGESACSDEDKQALLEEFIESENGNYALGASTDEKVKVKDVDGNNVTLAGSHAYAVKSADENTVTVINPWDSSEEIVLSKDTFLESFSSLKGIDLSDNNETCDYLIKTEKETVENSDGTSTKYIKDENGNILKEYNYDGDGNETSTTRYDDNGRIDYKYYYYSNGETRYVENYDYYDDGSISSQLFSSYKKNGQKSSESYYTYNENGTNKSSSHTNYNNGIITDETRKYYDEYGNLTSAVYKYYDDKGELSRTEKDTDGDGIIDSFEYA